MNANNLEKNLDKILITKNWNNVLLRNEIRKDIICFNEAVNERQIVEYLHNLSSEQLLDMRSKCFKLALDHYVEMILNRVALKPFLKDIQSEDFASKYVFKCNLMKDVVECIEYVIANSTHNSTNSETRSLPERCTDFSVNKRLVFPLGKKNLTRLLETIKALRVKLLCHEDVCEALKAHEIKAERMEKSLMFAKNRLDMVSTQNVFLKTCLTVLLAALILLTFVFLITNCLNGRAVK